MSRVFARAKFFDSDVSKWDVSRVKNMHGMFLGARSFNCDVSKWEVSSVTDMHGMFLGATISNQTEPLRGCLLRAFKGKQRFTI